VWQFEQINRKAVRRDPFEGEFFRGEGVSDRIKGHSEALVREVVQNAIDAAAPASPGQAVLPPVRLRFILRSEAHGLPAPIAHHYFGSLQPHLAALGLDEEIHDLNTGTVPFMVIEDFRTIGLTGDVQRVVDPDPNIPLAFPECFYWFWRNIGRSGKTKEQLGRWGLGKTVIPASSKINTFFGITRRADDTRVLLMGQSILKLHTVAGAEYLPEGFFCDPARNDLQMPFGDSETLTSFCRDFGIDRTAETGLSVVVPLQLPELKAAGLIKALVANFFVRIIRNEIAVTVQEDTAPAVEINGETLDAVTAAIDWDDADTGRQPPPPLAFVRAALEQKRSGGGIALRRVDGGSPQWVESMCPDPAHRSAHHAAFQNGELVCATVPLDLEMKDRSRLETSFFLAIQKPAEDGKGWEGYVRDGMRISRVSTAFAKLHYRGIVLVEDRVLSNFLGDAEGPAHLDWAESEKRPDLRYRTWVSRLRFVKKSLVSFLDLITPPPEQVDYSLYADFFKDVMPGPIDAAAAPAPRGGKETDDPPVIEPGPPKPFLLKPVGGGFHVRWNPKFEGSEASTEISVRYDRAGGAGWSPFDFEFGVPDSPIKYVQEGEGSATWFQNWIRVDNAKPGFALTLTGFKQDTDLVVRLKQ
jgi:hypothetical protein